MMLAIIHPQLWLYWNKKKSRVVIDGWTDELSNVFKGAAQRSVILQHIKSPLIRTFPGDETRSSGYMQDLSVTFSWLGPNHTALIKVTKNWR